MMLQAVMQQQRDPAAAEACGRPARAGGTPLCPGCAWLVLHLQMWQGLQAPEAWRSRLLRCCPAAARQMHALWLPRIRQVLLSGCQGGLRLDDFQSKAVHSHAGSRRY